MELLTVDDFSQAVVDFRGVHQLQVCYGVLLQESAAGPLLPDVISIVQVSVLNVDPVICMEGTTLRRVHLGDSVLVQIVLQNRQVWHRVQVRSLEGNGRMKAAD